MSGPGDSSYEDSPGETPDAADNDRGTTLTRSAGTEFADEPPAEPMSREEFADYMRQGAAADAGDEDVTGYSDGPDHSYDSRSGDPAEDAQGMTREEYADYIRQGSAAGEDDRDPADDHDAAGIDQSGDSGYDSPWGDPAEEAQGMTRGEYADYMQQGPAVGDDDVGIADAGAVSVVELTPADRTLGDTTPTGIGLKPTGEQLAETEDDPKSRLEKLRRNIYDRADDISDAANEHGGTLGNLFERPPTATHTEVPSTPHAVPNHQENGVDGGHLASAALVVGLLGFELFRTIKNRA
jgi:hypothetical protein